MPFAYPPPSSNANLSVRGTDAPAGAAREIAAGERCKTDLLAGFAKPGRGPKRPQGADFVSYYANKPARPLEPSAAREAEKAARAAKTEVHRPAEAVQPRGLKFHGMSASMSLLGQRLAMRSNVSTKLATSVTRLLSR